MTAIHRRVSVLTAVLLALLLGIVLSITAPAMRSGANPPPGPSGAPEIYNFGAGNADETGLAFRGVRLSGSPNTLIGTFEHWSPANYATKNVPYVIMKSTNDGASWTPIATVDDGNTAATHPWPVKWTPAIVELPQAAGAFPAGTLVMAAAVSKDNYTGTSEIQVWHSTNQGVTWTWSGVKVGPAGPGGGVWEPWLYIGGSGQLVMQFADDRGSGSADQVVAQIVSTNGGASWGSQTNIVSSSNFRPGMPATTKVGDGTYRMVFEYCSGAAGQPTPPICPVRTKTSTDGITWPSGIGDLVQSFDGRYAGGGPNIAYLPGQGSQGQIVVSSHAVRLLPGPTIMEEEDKQTLFVSYDNGVNWNRMGAPLDASIPPGTTNCGTVYSGGVVASTGYNWSGTIMPSLDGNSLRWFTSTHRTGSTECGVVSLKANVGALPYSADFTVNDSGWVPYGGNWNVTAGGKYDSSGSLGIGPKALAGSTGWTNYTVAADVTPTTGGDAGVLYRVSASAVGTDEMSGYYAGIGVGGGLFIGKMSAGFYTALGSQTVTGGIVSGSTYRVSVTANGSQHTATVSVGGVVKATLVVTDSSFLKGQIGLRNLASSATFDNVSVSAVARPYSQAFGAAVPEWVTYGGTWAVNAGKYEQNATGAGAGNGPKALIGSPTWTDYKVSADVSVNGSGGDAGVLFRVGHNPATGADAHTGYYAGISTGNILFVGRMDGATASPSYTTLGSIAIPGGVSAGAYYKVSLQGTGSSLVAEVRNATTNALIVALPTITDSKYSAGSAGLRSFLVGAKFDNVTVN